MPSSTKSLLKFYCKYAYYAGAGDFWYENGEKETKIYKVYMIISFSIYFIMFFLENMAALFGDFPEVEGKSAVMFSAIHNIILIKMFFIVYYKSSIRKLNNEMSLVMREIEEEYVMIKQQKKVLWGITLYVITVYLSLISYGIESLRKVIVEGKFGFIRHCFPCQFFFICLQYSIIAAFVKWLICIDTDRKGTPFYTVVTYFPSYYDDSIIASVFRIFFYMTWLYMMLPMIAADCMPITHLIIMAYKFVTLCHYYDKIREDFSKNLLIMNNQTAAKILKSDCLNGIKMHQKLMFLAEEIHRIFGIIMSLQVCESSAVAVLLLLRLALSPHMNLTNAFMTYTFVGSLFFLLALNLWNAGEVTYQASMLSNAMFYCDWHLCQMVEPTHRDIRRVILIGCAQAQKPLILKAFGIQDLSYSTFVSVSRMTYSIFAVFYQRRD